MLTFHAMLACQLVSLVVLNVVFFCVITMVWPKLVLFNNHSIFNSSHSDVKYNNILFRNILVLCKKKGIDHQLYTFSKQRTLIKYLILKGQLRCLPLTKTFIIPRSVFRRLKYSLNFSCIIHI